jgi:hypothetical protein
MWVGSLSRDRARQCACLSREDMFILGNWSNRRRNFCLVVEVSMADFFFHDTRKES